MPGMLRDGTGELYVMGSFAGEQGQGSMDTVKFRFTVLLEGKQTSTV